MQEIPQSATPDKKETPPRYGIYGYDLKREIIKSGRPIEFRAVIKMKKNTPDNQTDVRPILEDHEVLISNQGTMGSEPKIIDGVHKKRIDDELMVLLTEEGFGKLQIDLANITLYADDGEKHVKIDETIRTQISTRVSAMMQSIPPPPSRRRFGRPF